MFKYGCWITDKGEILDVDNSMAHIHVLRMATHDDMTYSLAYDAGWIRVVWRNGNPDFAAQCRYPTRAARSTLQDLVKDFFNLGGFEFNLCCTRQIEFKDSHATSRSEAHQLIHRLTTLEEELTNIEVTMSGSSR